MSNVPQGLSESMSARRRRDMGILLRFAVQKAQKGEGIYLEALCRYPGNEKEYDKTIKDWFDATGLSKGLSKPEVEQWKDQVKIASQALRPLIAMTALAQAPQAKDEHIAHLEAAGRDLACAADALRAAIPLVEEYLESEMEDRLLCNVLFPCP
jgi:hypothetical protein